MDEKCPFSGRRCTGGETARELRSDDGWDTSHMATVIGCGLMDLDTGRCDLVDMVPPGEHPRDWYLMQEIALDQETIGDDE